MRRSGGSARVLGFGVVALDEAFLLERHPGPDEKAAVLGRVRRLGGQAGNALAAAAGAGAVAEYWGELDDSEESDEVRGLLESAGVAVRGLASRGSGGRGGPARAWVWASRSEGTRAVLYDLGRARGPGDAPVAAAFEALEGAGALLVDSMGLGGVAALSRRARELGVAVVSDFESGDSDRFEEAAALSDHLIVSRDFGARWTGEVSAEGIAARLRERDAARGVRRALICVTDGARGARGVIGGEEAFEVAGIAVRSCDSTGCGDVFRGVYAACLARGLSIREALGRANAAGAWRASAPWGTGTRGPTSAEIEGMSG